MKYSKARRILSLMTGAALMLSMSTMAVSAEGTGVTRGELAKYLVEAAGMEYRVDAYAALDSAFVDVAEGSEYEGYINLVAAKGWMYGMGDDTFGADVVATELQAATTLMHYIDMPTGFATAWPADFSEMASIAGLTLDDDALLTSEKMVELLATTAEMAEKPVIGISWKSDTQDYSSVQGVVHAAGGIPVEMPQITDAGEAEDYVYMVDGLIVTGGEDINPDLYNEEAHPLLEDNTEARDIRDTSDINLIQQAVAADIPMIAICRGHQMFNVAMGGGLIQDIPSYLEVDSEEYDTHRVPASVEDRDYARHEITVEEGSLWLEDIIGGTELENVASWHHQAINPDRLGEGLTVVAYGPEDIIEAIEYQDNEFALGVQFHPERDVALGEDSICDYDICLSFFETLVAYADDSDKPVIGISWKSDTQDYSAFDEIVKRAGGVAVEMAQIETYEDALLALSTVDGIIVTGGEDVDPAIYGQEADPMLEAVNAPRDTSDIYLVQAAVAEDVPMLGICRGEQVFNVAMGGGLIQDIPTYFDIEVEDSIHRMPVDAVDRTYARHDVYVEDNSMWLEDILGGTVMVDAASWHHQAVLPEDLGEGLTIVAYGEDGVVEAIEYQANEFALGIQFHPERDVSLYDDAIADWDICMNFFRTLVGYAGN